MTCSCGLTWRAIRNGAPDALWRTMKMSACIAERLATVSSSDSPFDADETAMLRLMTSADRRFAAISKVVRVRVEGSKNRLNTLLPRRIGTFFTSRSVTPANDSAVSRIWTRISRGGLSMESRCCSSRFTLSWGLRCSCALRSMFGLQREGEPAVVAPVEAQPLAGGHFEPRAAILRADRQLPAAAVGQHHQRDACGAPVVEQLVHRRAHGAPAVKDVVDQQQLAAGDVERDLCALRVVLEAARGVVVAVERDVHQAQGFLNGQQLMQAFRQPGPTGVDAHHRGFRSDDRLQLAGELLAELFGLRQLHAAAPSLKYCSRIS